jgi:ribosomal protein S18 acetylase RimI-like enzyme
LLLEVGPKRLDSDEFSLFVYRDNVPALECYKAMGFAIRDFPEGASLGDECYYLTRPVFNATT